MAQSSDVEQSLPIENIPYILSEDNRLDTPGSVFTKFKTLQPQVKVDVGQGKIITKIEFYMNGDVVKTLNWGYQSIDNKVSLEGNQVTVTTDKNRMEYGGFFAWQRSAAATKWTPGSGDYTILESFSVPKDAHGADMYPGVKVDIPVSSIRSTAYMNTDYYSGNFKTGVINDDIQLLRRLNQTQIGVNVDAEIDRTNVKYPHGEGRVDPTTQIGSLVVKSLDEVDVHYIQNYDHEGYKVPLPAGGNAAMMYYLNSSWFILTSYTYQYPDKMKIYYKEGDGPPPGGGTTNPGGCTEPSPSGQVKESSLTPPDVRAVIKADARGNERFDVLDGIPTSESLYGNVWAKSYLSKNKFVQMSGKCTYEVTVNREYELKWDPGKKVPKPDGTGEMDAPDPQTATETLTKSYTIERPYSFWVIDNLEVYQIDQAKLWNYAFNGGGITITPSGYSPPSFSASKSSGYTPPNPPSSVDAPKGSKSGGKEKPDISNENLESYAEQAVEKVKVKNDSLTFNGSTIMSGDQSNESGPTPNQVPLPPEISQNVLYSPGNTIPTSKINQPSQPSTGTIYYGLMSGNINGGANVNYAIYGINPVTVHTPVVIYPEVSDDAEHNQKTRPAAGRSAVILDRPFTVEMPNSGQHANYRGYGYNNYLKYIGSKQVRFPFDVYDGSRTTFYPKNTWIEVDKTRESFTYLLPVWVDEGFYEVEFRTIAHNAPAGASQQNHANLDLAHHIAYDTVPVDVIGRVYDFRITDISDYNWETVFRASAGSALPTGTSYWVGLNGIDGAARGNTGRFTLPIRPGSHPLYQNVVIKTGYHFKFDLKTKGNMFGPNDRIRITPSFYFVSAKDGTRMKADLYYHAGNRSYVKIGSPRDQVQRYVILNERLRSVPMEELIDTALYKYDHDFTFDQISGISRTQYVQNYIRRISGKKTPIGSLSLLELNERIRTWIGPKNGIPSGVDPARVNASVQKWYGEYSLPADLYVVKAGTNVAEYGRTHNGLSDHSPVFLKDGYIVVNFNIETVRNGDGSNPYLQYINAPLMNQWTQMEGFARTVTDPYGRSFALRDGDVVFYDANRSSRDDFSSMVTH
ncbi:DUF5704 domain-containing protein [Paenibacillus sp. Marseille-P2973]|uniref:DUF5704 domain-containing protein n=1 Tax=Paenibacillus sp. Marseille-P2973 TaxID=1871032 RepID=UPI001B39AC37|nr:DUF5704 domain-containing protein [Paenibacillus sp. Marseille-P2973]